VPDEVAVFFTGVVPTPEGLGEEAAGAATRALEREAVVGLSRRSAASLLSTFLTGGGTGGVSAAVLERAREAAVGA
jgi:hypothetical protein